MKFKKQTYFYIIISTVFASLSYCQEDHTSSFERQIIAENQKYGTRTVSKDEHEEIETALKKYSAKVSNQELEAALTGTIEINVYWTVFQDSFGSGALSNDVIEKQMQILNDAFEGIPSSYEACGFNYDNTTLVKTPFRFNLVDTNVVTDNDAFNLEWSASMKKRIELRQGNCSDLNIFTGDSWFWGAGDFWFWDKGFSSFPFDCDLPENDDSIAISYRTLPEQDIGPHNEGDNLIRFVGHWLGLYNTFEGGCLSRDYVTDTPPQAFASTGCPIGQNSCSGSGRDPIHNFMDLSDDCCKYSFTNGQVVRMILLAGLYRDLSAENVTLPEITEPACGFPDDGFNYSACEVENPCWLGDGFCDSDVLSGYNTTECNLDGDDCRCEFPDDGFDYSNCTVEFPCWIGNGICDSYYTDEYGSKECNSDGGDCITCEFPDDGFDYSSCDVPWVCNIGDGFCDGDGYNTGECNRDGGDCNWFSLFFRYLGTFLALPFFVCYCYWALSWSLLIQCLSDFFPNLPFASSGGADFFGDGLFPFPTV